MWPWDQGRLEYFQFDVLRQIAAYVEAHNFKAADRASLSAETGLSFAPLDYKPWRNYSRVLKLTLLVSEVGEDAQPTPIASILSRPGAVTCDEYLHFLLCAFTEPAPALTDWRPDAEFRYPLLFALKYLLAKSVITTSPVAGLDEIIGAYRTSGFDGSEDEEQFISVVSLSSSYEASGRSVPADLRRQARESLKVITQISYLHVRSNQIIVSLNPADAQEIFADLAPISGPRAVDREAEIRRLAELFKGGSTSIVFDYLNTVIGEVVESGFQEGSKVKKTHITIERNAGLRREYFAANPTAICDVCAPNTKRTYPWTNRILDVHHLLPLSSGTRVEGGSTTFKDLVAVCPSCHRAIHRYYDMWLDTNDRKDFKSGDEAQAVYREMKSHFPGLIL
ncbi:HNH endonuclease [Candidatus Cyanaurora vandensis]|uniref:HNH endonuclease n=1 Tax=Candidatus Cyanaurora vandensis TaxID=2714958 RepID=UPI00257D4345|nr:HNH endonuclease [Candidatus Cyanaurora vandensis]